MQSVPPPGFDPAHILCIGESQGYRGLYVHFGITFDHGRERQTTQLTTAFLPTPEQLAALNEGKPLIISLINVTQHPPIMVDVSDKTVDDPGATG
jgi:hypothetical protein